MAAEEAIRDWWYSGRRQGMTSKEAAQSLLWHLAKCDLEIIRKPPDANQQIRTDDAKRT